MRVTMLACVAGVVWVVPALPQAIVESAILGPASGAAGPAAGRAGASAAGVFESLRKALAAANAGLAAPGGHAALQPGAVSLVTIAAPGPEELRAVLPKDVSGIAPGQSREELLEKYGLPALKTSEAGGGETFTYFQGKNEPVTITLRDGVVTAVSRKPRKSSAVVSLK